MELTAKDWGRAMRQAPGRVRVATGWAGWRARVPER